MEACYYGQLTVVELLRERGATWLARDKAGLSPLHWAVDGGHIDVVQYILNDGMDVSKGLSSDEKSHSVCTKQVDDTDGISNWTPLMRLGKHIVNLCVVNNKAIFSITRR